MKIFILVVMMHVNGGGIINFQEFNSIEQCNHTASIINSKAASFDDVRAFCVRK